MSSLDVEQFEVSSVERTMSGWHDQNSAAIKINRLPAKPTPALMRTNSSFWKERAGSDSLKLGRAANDRIYQSGRPHSVIHGSRRNDRL